MSNGAERTQEELAAENLAVLVGYLCAVSGAALSFVFLVNLRSLTENGAGGVSLADFFWYVLIPMVLKGACFWFVAFFTAMPPFAATFAVALWLKVRGVFYYAACGALTGLMLTPVFVSLGPQQGWMNYNTFDEDCVFWGPILIASGACGAVAFWYRAGRRFRLA